MNKKTQLERAKKLRTEMTDAESLLWGQVRSRNLAGLKFKRQVPVGKYIVDFLCSEKKVIVELDGGQHMENLRYDDQRTKFLEQKGFLVKRFWNHDVLSNCDSVCREIVKICKA